MEKALKKVRPLQGFVDFVREQGVVGLAVGLVLGSAVKSIVDSLVTNIVNPIVGLLLGGVDLRNKQLCLNSVKGACTNAISWGNFVSSIISFITIAAIVYFVVRGLKLDKIDKKKEEEPKSKK